MTPCIHPKIIRHVLGHPVLHFVSQKPRFSGNIQEYNKNITADFQQEIRQTATAEDSLMSPVQISHKEVTKKQHATENKVMENILGNNPKI